MCGKPTCIKHAIPIAVQHSIQHSDQRLTEGTCPVIATVAHAIYEGAFLELICKVAVSDTNLNCLPDLHDKPVLTEDTDDCHVIRTVFVLANLFITKWVFHRLPQRHLVPHSRVIAGYREETATRSHRWTLHVTCHAYTPYGC